MLVAAEPRASRGRHGDVMSWATGGGTYWSYPSNHHETATEAAARPSDVPRSETPPSTAPPSAAYPATVPSSPPHPSASATPAASIAAAVGRGTWSGPPCWWQRSHALRAAATGTSCRGRRGGASFDWDATASPSATAAAAQPASPPLPRLLPGAPPTRRPSHLAISAPHSRGDRDAYLRGRLTGRRQPVYGRCRGGGGNHYRRHHGSGR